MLSLYLVIRSSDTCTQVEHRRLYPLIDISRSFIEQKDFLSTIIPLRESLKEIYPNYDEKKISVYIEFLNTGANIAYNQDVRHYPASLIKMPVAIATARKIENKEWTWDNQLVLFPQDVDSRSGVIAGKPIGSRFTIRELLEAMLIDSDNTAYNILLRNVGAEAINDFLSAVGLESLFDSNLQITAKEYTQIFRSLYTSNYLDRELSQILLDMLSKTEDDLLLDKGLPDDVLFSHKFGTNLDGFVYADSGIVYLPNRPYLITVFYQADQEDSEEKIFSLFEEISSTTYAYFSK